MATHPSEFQDLADELINDEFAEFRKTLTLTYGGTYNPATETTTGQTTATYQAIPAAIDFKEYQSLGLEITDISAVYTRTADQIPPVGAKVAFDGRNWRVLSAIGDTAGATVKLFLRAI
jgi:hypothetical protein